MRARFLIPPLAVMALFAAVSLFWIPSRVENLLRSELTRRGKLAAETLDKSSIGALVVQDQGALNQLAKGFLRSNEILYVLILDKDGQTLADSGIDKRDAPGVERHLPQVLNADSDFMTTDRWASTGEPCFHISRPVFYEQLRIGTIVLGISARWNEMVVSQFRWQLILLWGVILIAGIGLAVWMADSVSLSLQKIAEGIETHSQAQLETLAGPVKEFQQLVECIQRNKDLFKSSLSELGQQKLELETELAKKQEENSTLSSRLGVVIQQLDGLQEHIMSLETQSAHLHKLIPLVQFATGIAPEIDTSMQHISQSAEQLRSDLERLSHLIALYEKASLLVAGDLEDIQQYKNSINYQQIKQSMDELVTTIRGGANWTEQLTELLKQMSVGDLSGAR